VSTVAECCIVCSVYLRSRILDMHTPLIDFIPVYIYVYIGMHIQRVVLFVQCGARIGGDANGATY